jgi:hypothetical protein
MRTISANSDPGGSSAKTNPVRVTGKRHITRRKRENLFSDIKYLLSVLGIIGKSELEGCCDETLGFEFLLP